MYDFTGCECTICHQPFRIDSDVVVCPDCGTPYHRDCYERLGHCKNVGLHGTDFSWQPPELQQRTKMIACPRCNTENDKNNEYCKKCGLSLVIFKDVKGQGPSKGKTATAQSNTAYATAHADPAEFFKHGIPTRGRVLDQNDTFEDIPVAEWVSFIGFASPAYLATFQQMKLLKRKYSFSLSAMLFGPLYFFYRKTWDIALFFTLVTVLLNIPSLLLIMLYSESAYMPAISESTLDIMAQVCVALNWAVLMLRGLYGTYLYQKSAARTIKKIKAKVTKPRDKAFLLRMHGGTSFGAVALAITAMIVLASGFSLLLGPNFDALTKMLTL